MFCENEEKHHKTTKYVLHNNVGKNSLVSHKGKLTPKKMEPDKFMIVMEKACQSTENMEYLRPFEQMKKSHFASNDNSLVKALQSINMEGFMEIKNKLTSDYLEEILKNAEIIKDYLNAIKDSINYRTSLTYIKAQQNIESDRALYAKSPDLSNSKYLY